MQSLIKQPAPLFFKPSTLENSTSENLFFSKYWSDIPATIFFRPINLETDLPIIHQWVNSDYALQYWQLNGHFSQLFALYQCMELNPYAHSFIGILKRGACAGNDERPICQFDVYSVAADELKSHVDLKPHDCGFHLIMAPNNNPIRGLTVSIVNSFLAYYFSFSEAQRMYAEPDVSNEKSIVLLEKCGFERIKTVQMSYKKAHIYVKEKS